MLSTGFRLNGPAAVRYPRGRGPGAAIDDSLDPLPVGKAEPIRSGKEVALLAFGSVLANTLEAGERLDASVVNMRFVKPLDEACIAELAARHKLLVTVEDNAVEGGAGSAVGEALARSGISTPLICLGIPDRFIEHASREEQLGECGLDAESIYHRVQRELAGRIATLRAVD
jgi:1-deoxy-D-xylulose-5-phosphate synthase